MLLNAETYTSILKTIFEEILKFITVLRNLSTFRNNIWRNIKIHYSAKKRTFSSTFKNNI